MSGLKTEIIEGKPLVGMDSLCLDQYPDGSVRLICNEHFNKMDDIVCEYERTAHIHLSKKEMMRLIHTYLKNEEEWGSLADVEEE